MSLEGVFAGGEEPERTVGLPQNPRPHPFLLTDSGGWDTTGVLLQSSSVSAM